MPRKKSEDKRGLLGPLSSKPADTVTRFDLRRVTRTLYDIQDMRKRVEGRLGLKSDGKRKEVKVGDGSNLGMDVARVNSGVYAELALYLGCKEKKTEQEQSSGLKKTEQRLAKMQKAMIDEHFPFGKLLVAYPGIDYKLAGVILSEIDIVEATTVSKLWRYTGGDPTAKMKKGEKLKYNKFLKTKLYGCFGQMSCLKKTHPMRGFYDARKMRREAQEWGQSKMHRHLDSVRYAVKMWIATWLYPEWRAFEGLPVRQPYQEEYLGHKHNDSGKKKQSDVGKESSYGISPLFINLSTRLLKKKK